MGRRSRRQLLAGLGAAAVGGLAGCSGDGGSSGSEDYPTLQYGEWYTEQPVFDYSVENYRTTTEVFYQPENRTLQLADGEVLAVVTCKIKNTDDRERDSFRPDGSYFLHYNNPGVSDRVYLEEVKEISHPEEGDIREYRPQGVGELPKLPPTLEPGTAYRVAQWGVGPASEFTDPSTVYLTVDNIQFTRSASFQPPG